jgi:hypothetical protein
VHPEQDLVLPHVNHVAKLAGQPDGVRVDAVVEGDTKLEPVNSLGLRCRGGEGEGGGDGDIGAVLATPSIFIFILEVYVCLM